MMLYRHNTPGGGSILVRRMTVARHAETSPPSVWHVRRVTRHRIPDRIGRNSEEISGSIDLPGGEN